MSKRRRKKTTAGAAADTETPESAEVAVAEQDAADQVVPGPSEPDPTAPDQSSDGQIMGTDDDSIVEWAEDTSQDVAVEGSRVKAEDPAGLDDLAPPGQDEPEGEWSGEPEASGAEDIVERGGLSRDLSPEQVVEAVLFSSDAPLPLAKLTGILGVGSARDIRGHIESLNKRYEKQGATFRIENIAGGYQMLTLPVFNTWVRKLKQSRQDSRLSAAALETLAIVAYKQPVVRADIEALRGVASGEMLNRLRELGLVKIVGRAEDVGRPMLYGTTRRFLEVFGLSNLDELPEVEELQSPG
jgi:segregation and condensation protein B